MKLPKKKILTDEALSGVNGGGYSDLQIEKSPTMYDYCPTCDMKRTFELRDDGNYYCEVCGEKVDSACTMI